jgi:glycosyltransferase involved in cell wall biosynthesis
MDITLIIPAYNEEAVIGACISAALKSKGDFKEIIVVDNACTDKTKEIALTFPGVRMVREDKKGLTHARQAGLQAATTEYVGYIDADTRMPVGWVAKAEKLFASNTSAVAVSGPAHYFDATRWQKFCLTLGWWGSAPLSYALTGYMIYGAHFVVKRSALVEIGGFNTGIEFYGEDTDIAKRLSKVGKVIFNMHFYINTSARRFQEEGMARMMYVYSVNFIWPALFGKPYTKGYKDIRKS